jgi:hypothetical protein
LGEFIDRHFAPRPGRCQASHDDHVDLACHADLPAKPKPSRRLVTPKLQRRRKSNEGGSPAAPGDVKPPMMPGVKNRRVSSSAETCQDLLPDPQFSLLLFFRVWPLVGNVSAAPSNRTSARATSTKDGSSGEITSPWVYIMIGGTRFVASSAASFGTARESS